MLLDAKTRCTIYEIVLGNVEHGLSGILISNPRRRGVGPLQAALAVTRVILCHWRKYKNRRQRSASGDLAGCFKGPRSHL